MRTWNLGIKYRERDKRNRFHWRGVLPVLDRRLRGKPALPRRRAARLEDLEGLYPSGRDGLAITQIACAAHESIETGAPVIIEPPRS